MQAEQRCEQALRELFRCAEVIRAQAVEAIWHQQGAAEGQAKGSLLELQQELEQLWRTRQQLQELTQEDDCVHFLQVGPPALGCQMGFGDVED